MSLNSAIKINKWGIILIITFIFICISFAFSFLVIKNFSGPLAGIAGLGPWPALNHDPVDLEEYTAFYFAKNLYFNPFPQLNLVNNQVFYPYGTNSVFSDWQFEAGIFYGILHLFFPTGPLLQIYYLISVLITAIGAFILLMRDYGLVRALGASFFVSFGNFYTINKYSHHLSVAVVHWTILSVIVDFLIVKRVVLKQHVSLRLILIRFCLLFLTFGQSLGYIAGFGLMSFTISILFIILLTYYRYFKGDFRVIIDLIRKEIEAYKIDFFASPRICLILLVVGLLAGYMYLPLVMQISREAKSFDFTGVDLGSFWINPFRLFIPYFPVINTPKNTFENIFHDFPEAIGAGTPGWFLLIIGSIGLWQNRKQITIFIPLLSIFILCFLYIPEESSPLETLDHLLMLILAGLSLWFTRKLTRIFILTLFIILCLFWMIPTIFLLPTLKIFPWFTFNRVAGRSTVLYSTIFGIFALYINLGWLSFPKRRLFTGFLVFLACTELVTAYSFRLYYQEPKSLNKDFFAYMDYVKKQPGEAVLDWPFCIAESTMSMCMSSSGAFALRRFHEKKVIGEYFGRVHSSQIEPFLRAGWTNMFLPNKTYSHQRRCFNQEEWSFFTDFYKLNDFAGINLYLDKLPEKCLNEFYSRFGNPVMETLVPGVGRVKFIPKSAKYQNQVNLVLGANLKFTPSDFLDLSDGDLLDANKIRGLTLIGLTPILIDKQGNYFRWGYGPGTLLGFELSKSQDLELVFSFDNPIGFYNTSLEINGSPIKTFSNIKVGTNIKEIIKFRGVKGMNKIIFKYEKNNNFANNQSLTDEYRVLIEHEAAIEFRKLSISALNKS